MGLSPLLAPMGTPHHESNQGRLPCVYLSKTPNGPLNRRVVWSGWRG